MFNFGLQQRSHTVIRLPVHLDGQQNIIFEQDKDISSTLKKGKHTKLTRYFELCKKNPSNTTIQSLRYIDVPKHYIWNKNNWQKRKEMVKM